MAVAMIDGEYVNSQDVWLISGQNLSTIEERHKGALSAAASNRGKFIALPQQYTFWEKFRLNVLSQSFSPKYVRMAICIEKDGDNDKVIYKPLKIVDAELELITDGLVVSFSHGDRD